jgi:peptidoglycan/LPS O-acetylase OafA/YrhL
MCSTAPAITPERDAIIVRQELSAARIPGADGLRAIACLLVVWHHTAQKLNPDGLSPLIATLHFLGMRGEVGVSLFFVLSGCLLSVPFWASFVESRPFPSLKRYSLNRVARIAPAFWLNLIICNILAVVLFNLEFSWQKFSTAFLFINSYHFSTFFPTEVNGPLWSIGLEVSCYVLLPIVLYAIFKTAKSTALAFAGLITAILALQAINPLVIQLFMTDKYQRGWQFGLDGGAKQWLPYWNISTFFTQFLIGSLAALVIAHLRARQTHASRLFDFTFVTAAVSAVVLVAARLTPGSQDSFTQQPYVSPFFALLVAVLLVSASHSVFVSRALDNRLFSWIAKLSFGIYLWHMVVIEVIVRKFIKNYVYFGLHDVWQWVLISAFVLVASTAIAAVSWRMLESPILQAVRRRSASRATRLTA